MYSPGTCVLTMDSEAAGSGDTSSPKTVAGAKSGQARRGTLSRDRVAEIIADLIGRRFYGKLTLSFEAGLITYAKLEQTIKE